MDKEQVPFNIHNGSSEENENDAERATRSLLPLENWNKILIRLQEPHEVRASRTVP